MPSPKPKSAMHRKPIRHHQVDHPKQRIGTTTHRTCEYPRWHRHRSHRWCSGHHRRPIRTVTVTEGYIEAFALCNGPYQGTIEDFDAAAGITGINADLHNLLTHAHMYNAVDQATDEPEKS